MSISVKDKEKRAHLFRKQKCRCYYCKRLLVNDLKRNDWYNSRQLPPPDNTATLEHLYPREDIRRFLINNYQNIVVACYRCNQIRNDEFLGERNREYVSIISMLQTGMVITCELPSFREIRSLFKTREEAKRHFRQTYVNQTLV